MDTNRQNDIQSGGIESRLLASLIIELNISRRNFKSYPNDHPVVEDGFQKVISIYNTLLEGHDEISIGVAKEALMFGTEIFEKSNPVYRDFARVLFEHNIGVLTLRPGLTTTELKNFNIILGLKRDEINRHGGIETLWEKGHITALAITAIRYDLFSISENGSNANDPSADSAEGIWERFTRGLMAGSISQNGEQTDKSLNPEALAAMLNDRYKHATGSKEETDCIQTITDLMIQESSRPSSQHATSTSYKKLAAFVSNLNPNLRRQFLSSTFKIKTVDGHQIAEDIIGSMSAEAVLETLEDVNKNQADVPPIIMGLLQKLSAHVAAPSPSRHLDYMAESDIQQKMRTVFKEHASEEFIPDIYQQQLNSIISESQIPQIHTEDFNDLLATVQSNVVENRISDIIMNLITAGEETPEEREFLLRNLSDMFGYFLQTGDYGQLVKMIDRTMDGSFPIDVQYYLREYYASREFLDEILNGLTIWGKPRYDDIKFLITKLRSSFIEVLLDRIATEDNISLRRFMMDRLIEMGPMTRVPIAVRLHDERWFVLRNLIIILRAYSDVALIPLIRPLATHSNKRVRLEALSTLVMLHDADSEKQILRDLDSNDRETLFTAINLSEKSRLIDIHKKLLSMLSNGGLSQPEYELKSAVVKALGEIHRTEALTEFAKILASSSLFNKKLLTRLKLDIIRAMEHFPLQIVSLLLERLSSGKDEVAQQALKALNTVKAKSHEH